MDSGVWIPFTKEGGWKMFSVYVGYVFLAKNTSEIFLK